MANYNTFELNYLQWVERKVVERNGGDGSVMAEYTKALCQFQLDVFSNPNLGDGEIQETITVLNSFLISIGDGDAKTSRGFVTDLVKMWLNKAKMAAPMSQPTLQPQNKEDVPSDIYRNMSNLNLFADNNSNSTTTITTTVNTNITTTATTIAQVASSNNNNKNINNWINSNNVAESGDTSNSFVGSDPRSPKPHVTPKLDGGEGIVNNDNNNNSSNGLIMDEGCMVHKGEQFDDEQDGDSDLEFEFNSNNEYYIYKENAQDKRLPCRYFMKGSCLRADCGFSHEVIGVVCKFWLQGHCFKGDSCEYYHEYPSVIHEHTDMDSVESEFIVDGTNTSSIGLGDFIPTSTTRSGNLTSNSNSTNSNVKSNNEPLGNIDLNNDFPSLGSLSSGKKK